MLKKNNLFAIDFNALYRKQREVSSFKPKTRSDWDKKATDFNGKVFQSAYNGEFIRRVKLDAGDTLLDIGCGVGNLSLAFAQKAGQVYALDYSSAMLSFLKENMAKEHITNITPLELSWDDSWEKVPKADVVIASRSMEVEDMETALKKMDAKAKKVVYLTYKAGGSFIDPVSLEVIGRDVEAKPDYIYILNILYTMGINASLDFIESEGKGNYIASSKEYADSVRWSLGELTAEEEAKLVRHYESLDEKQKKELSRPVKWAFIYWGKDDHN